MDNLASKVFGLRNLPPWRRQLVLVTQKWYFTGTVHTAILYAAGALAWPYVTWPNLAPYANFQLDPYSEDPTLPFYLVSDVLVLLIFTVEAVVKIIAFGTGLRVRKQQKFESDDDDGDDLDISAHDHVKGEKTKLQPEEERAIQEMFDLFDVDSSGSINQVELRLAMRGLGFDESADDLKRMFDDMDSDGNQEVDFEEFKEVLAAKIYNQPPPPGYFKLRWNRFDFCILAISWAVLPFQYNFPAAKRLGDIARLVRLARLWAALESQKLRVVKDIILVFSASLFSSTQIFTLIASILFLYSTMGLSLFGDGALNGKCIVSGQNSMATKWNADSFGKPSTIGELQQPIRHCGDTLCESEYFRCGCNKSFNVLSGTGPLANLGCSRLPLGQFGEQSGTHPVTMDFGFLGFNNFLQGFLTSFVSMTESRWTRALDNITLAYNPPSTFLFFVSLFVFGRLWVVNLFTASVTSAYGDISSERKIKERKEANALAEKRIVQRLREKQQRSGQAVEDSSLSRAQSSNILDRLGQLKDASPKDLSAKIHEVFIQVDKNRSGYVERQEVDNLLKALGIQLTREQEDKLFTTAQKNRERYMDEDEFEELVKSIIAHSRREARDAEQAATADVQDDEPLKLFGLFQVSRSHLEPNTVPLNKWSLAVAKVLAYPHKLDECGERVPYEITFQAKRRNLVIHFGPSAGQWTVCAGDGGASIGINLGNTRKDPKGTLVKELFPSDQPIPGGEGFSVDSSREDLIKFILEFDIHSKYLKDNSNEATWAKEPSDQPYSEMIAMLFILISTVILCCLHFDGTVDMSCSDPSKCPDNLVIMSRSWILMISVFEAVFNGVFTIEAGLKMFAHGFLRYIIRKRNRFDLAVAIVCDIGLILWYVMDSRSNMSFIRLIRLLRILQMISLMDYMFHWENLYRKSLSGLSGQLPIFCLLFFSISLVAIIGMNSFPCLPHPSKCSLKTHAGVCPPFLNQTCERSPLCPLYAYCPFHLEQNFNSFSDAFNLVFMIAMTKGWEDLMFAGMRMYNTSLYGLVYFISAYCFFNFFVVNVCFAIVLDGFRLTDESKEEEQIKSFHENITKLLESEHKEALQGSGTTIMKHALEDQGNGSILWFAKRRLDSRAHHIERYFVFGVLPPPMPDEMNPEARRNLRGFARDLMKTSAWENLVLVAILISCIWVSLQSPISDFSTIAFMDHKIGPSITMSLTIFCFIVFFSEMILKVLVLGVFWESRKAYLRRLWNVIDLVIIIAFLLEFAGFSDLVVIRVLRSLRLTRLVRTGPVMLLQSILNRAIWDLRTLFIFVIFVFVVSSIMAQSFFYGTLNSCTDSDQGLRPTHLSIDCDPYGNSKYDCDPATGKLLAPHVSRRIQCVGTFLDHHDDEGNSFAFEGDQNEILRPRAWSYPRYSFDSFGDSIQSMVEVFAVDEWVGIASLAASGVGIGKSPMPKQQASAWLFFIIFLVITRLSLIPLFLGVIMDHLTQAQGTARTTTLQENWSRFEERLMKTKPIVPISLPNSVFRRHIFVMVNSIPFKRACNYIIVLNVILLASNYYDEESDWKEILYWMNVAFVTLYVIEIVCKLIAYALPFFEDPWNLFDLTVVTFGVLELCNIPGLGFPAVLVFRVIKCFRIVRFLRGIAKLQLMLKVLSKCRKLIFGAFLLIVIYIFFFSVVGCQIFAGVKRGRGITKEFNLDTTLNAFQLLFVIATGRGFGAVLRDTAVQPPMCTSCTACVVNQYGEMADFDDCGPVGSQAFFDIYIILAHTIFLQLLVAVVVDQYTVSVAETKFVLQNSHLDNFCRRWHELDSRGTGKISIWSLRTILERLHLDANPLGSCALCDEFNHRSVRIEILEGQDDDTYFEFHKTLRTLALCVAGAKALPYGEMMRRRERLAFYAQAAVISKAALLFGQYRHAHNVQGNLCAERALAAVDDPAAALRNAERTTFCFHLLSGERMVVIDAASATVFVQRGARCERLEASFRVRDLSELRCKAQGADANVVHMGTADGQHFAADFFDQTQAMRFASIVRTLRRVTGEGGAEHLEALRRQQVLEGMSPERDPLDGLALRHIATAVEADLLRALRSANDRRTKVD